MSENFPCTPTPCISRPCRDLSQMDVAPTSTRRPEGFCLCLQEGSQEQLSFLPSHTPSA